MKKIAVFASGNGSNFVELVNQSKNLNYHVSFLFCDRKEAIVLKKADSLKIPTFYLSIIKEAENFDTKLLKQIVDKKIDLIVLAGYMKLLSSFFIKNCPVPIINIHPSLLPKFPGKNAIERAFKSNESEFGITIHFVDEGIDTGKIIFQKSFLKNENDTLEQVVENVHKLEHHFYAPIIAKVLLNK